MNDLIDAIAAFLQAGIDAGDVSANKIYKGLGNIPDEPPVDLFPYIAIDDAGERMEQESSEAQRRIYSVLIEFGVGSWGEEGVTNNLINCLTLSDEIKAEFEKEANRQKDGYRWGVTIEPFDGNADDENNMKFYFRGRTVTVEYDEIEYIYQDF